MTNAELIKALRYCKINEPCERCPLVADDDGNGKCVNEMHDNAVDAIEKLVAENERLNGIIDVFVNNGTSVQSAWISVKDRLPYGDESVLVCFSEGGIDMAYFNGKDFDYMFLHPTHWMPLPDAPEVDEQRIAELEQIAKHYEQSAEDWWKEAYEYKQRIAELEARTPKWTMLKDEMPKPHTKVLVSGIEAINNTRVYKVMVNDNGTLRPTDYAPSIMWDCWMPFGSPNCGARMKGEEK